MANNNNKKNNNNNNNNGGGSRSSLNKISFWIIGAMSILYILSGILSAIGGSAIVSLLAQIFNLIATVCVIAIVCILAWRYVARKPMIWKVLYFVFIGIILIGIILPLCF